jgi:hypothetical protein
MRRTVALRNFSAEQFEQVFVSGEHVPPGTYADLVTGRLVRMFAPGRLPQLGAFPNSYLVASESPYEPASLRWTAADD